MKKCFKIQLASSSYLDLLSLFIDNFKNSPKITLIDVSVQTLIYYSILGIYEHHLAKGFNYVARDTKNFNNKFLSVSSLFMFHIRSDSAVCFLNCFENYILIHVFENILLLKNISGGRTRWWSSWTWSTSLSTDTSGMHLQTEVLAKHQLRVDRST